MNGPPGETRHDDATHSVSPGQEPQMSGQEPEVSGQEPEVSGQRVSG